MCTTTKDEQDQRGFLCAFPEYFFCLFFVFFFFCFTVLYIIAFLFLFFIFVRSPVLLCLLTFY